MKTRVLTVLCALAIGLGGVNVASAAPDPIVVTADVIFVRPVCFVATIAGSCVWVLGLPIAACSKSIKSSADVLIGMPARATFTRPLGDMNMEEGD